MSKRPGKRVSSVPNCSAITYFKKVAENRKVIDGFSNYLRQAVLTGPGNLETVIRTMGNERDRAETEIQPLERELVNKVRQLGKLLSDRQERGPREYLQQVLENFDSQSDGKKRQIIQTNIPRIVVLPKNKIRLQVRTDFRSETSAFQGFGAQGGRFWAWRGLHCFLCFAY